MPRQNRIDRAPGKRVVVTLDGVQHTLTESAFIELMTRGLHVLSGIVKLPADVRVQVSVTPKKE